MYRVESDDAAMGITVGLTGRPMLVAICCATALASCGPRRHIVGSVNTEFKLIGPDHKIVIESYDDPKIDGITVFISKSQKGGIKGALGLAEDTSDASVAVRQTGPIKVKEAFENGEDALTEQRSVLFKRLHVSRFWDAPHKSLCMSYGPTGSLTARRRTRFRRSWPSPGGTRRLISL
jgi:CreA protein